MKELVVRFDSDADELLTGRDVRRVSLDGRQICVRHIYFDIEPDKPITVYVRVLPGEIEFDGICHVIMTCKEEE